MHSPNYRKAVCLFFKPAFNFLSIIYCRCNCFYFVGGFGVTALCSLSELVLEKLMKAVDKEVAGKLVMPGYYRIFIWHEG